MQDDSEEVILVNSAKSFMLSERCMSEIVTWKTGILELIYILEK